MCESAYRAKRLGQRDRDDLEELDVGGMIGEGLGPAKGIMIGIVWGLALWVLIGLLLTLLWGIL